MSRVWCANCGNGNFRLATGGGLADPESTWRCYHCREVITVDVIEMADNMTLGVNEEGFLINVPEATGPTWDDVERDFGHYQHTHKDFGPEEYVEPEPKEGKSAFGPEDYGPDDVGELVEAKPPDGWRWATAEETEMYQRFGVPGMLVVPLTDDETGEQYAQQEADLAVPADEG